MMIFKDASWGLLFTLCSLHKSHNAFSAVLIVFFSEMRSKNMLLINSGGVSIN